MVKLRPSPVLVVCLAASALHWGCGSDPTGPSTATITLTLPSDPTLDGFVTNDGNAVAHAGGPAVGDIDSIKLGLAGRQFFSFEITNVPAGAEIVSATLQLYQASVGGHPFSSLGSLVVDRVDLGAGLDSGDYAGPALQAWIGTMPPEETLGYKSLDVTAAVQAERAAGRPRFQVRLRFSDRDSDLDGEADLVSYADAEQSCCANEQPSQLVVVFRP